MCGLYHIFVRDLPVPDIRRNLWQTHSSLKFASSRSTLPPQVGHSVTVRSCRFHRIQPCSRCLALPTEAMAGVILHCLTFRAARQCIRGRDLVSRFMISAKLVEVTRSRFWRVRFPHTHTPYSPTC